MSLILAVFVNFVAFGPFSENKIAFSRQIHLSERLFYFQNLHAMREEPSIRLAYGPKAKSNNL
ncbi:hypothetical protein [Alkalihalobacillus sp. BA299]|uniref:hypothetical protein n=1 Tax=Alkalihalobacillus sp. BA299 TaxID=2815938 RepID=UPI001ADBEDA1|nr:hypothetical protein [Alkalihalobacillus sp. BA299]